MGKKTHNSAQQRAVPDGAPTRERRAHGPIVRSVDQIIDVHGARNRPHIARDILEVMENSRTITRAMRQAGDAFREEFGRANLEALRAPDVGRTPGLGRTTDDPISVIAARDRVWAMIGQVGGLKSPAGQCLWHVLGLEMTLRDWAVSTGWNGRACHQMAASGILVAALGALAAPR